MKPPLFHAIRGCLGEYKYYDMDQVIAAALNASFRILCVCR